MQAEKRKANTRIPQQPAQKMTSTWRKFNAAQINVGRDHKLFSFSVQIADHFPPPITLFVSTTSKVKEHTCIVTASLTLTINANPYIYSVGIGLHIFCKRAPCGFLVLFDYVVHLLQLHGSFSL
jgi:hypothetical protein